MMYARERGYRYLTGPRFTDSNSKEKLNTEKKRKSKGAGHWRHIADSKDATLETREKFHESFFHSTAKGQEEN